jgi:hypothetical protein
MGHPRADAYQLLAAGLKGGKGVPDRISEHPRLFVTFTAPSFGKVHSRRAAGAPAAALPPASPRCPLTPWCTGWLLAPA